jgi:hypothetical protein
MLSVPPPVVVLVMAGFADFDAERRHPVTPAASSSLKTARRFTAEILAHSQRI